MDYVSIGRCFTILHRRSQAFVTAACAQLHLTYSEYVLMIRLYDAEGASQEELASMLYLDKAVVTRSLASLEQKGMVRREQDGRDRRIKRIYPTEFAQTQKTFLQGIIRAWVRYLAAGMEQAEVETTIRGFHDAAKRACELRIPDDVARCLEKGE
ncbi:MarR family winged helix-turn-helix transcriptional regulator [Selenomonas bovis]|uniref:MarR family winged helix-turn-helix transcriptional regulator n=1 Tax=Selenomonas bovis TaxID=416586 RepID=UPI003CFC0D2F